MKTQPTFWAAFMVVGASATLEWCAASEPTKPATAAETTAAEAAKPGPAGKPTAAPSASDKDRRPASVSRGVADVVKLSKAGLDDRVVQTYLESGYRPHSTRFAYGVRPGWGHGRSSFHPRSLR